MKKVFLALLVLLGCGKEQEDLPPNLLSQEQMVAFLIDTHMIEGQLQAARIDRDSAGAVYQGIEADLYEKHQIDSQQFVESYHYYLANVEQLSDIYDAVIDSLSLREKVLINQKN